MLHWFWKGSKLFNGGRNVEFLNDCTSDIYWRWLRQFIHWCAQHSEIICYLTDCPFRPT